MTGLLWSVSFHLCRTDLLHNYPLPPSLPPSLLTLSHCFCSPSLPSSLLTLSYPPLLPPPHTVAPDVTADAVGLVDVPVGIGTLMISCSYLGIPPPLNVNWARDDITLDPDADSRVTVEFDDTRTTLTITEVMENEGGTYRCVPTNIVGSNSATTQVRIQRK